MVWIDYVIIGIILISASISIARGFIKEFFSLASWIVAFWVARTYHIHLATLLIDYIATPSIRLSVAFAVLFIIILILGALINHLISQLVVKTGLTGADRTLGVVFGLLRGVAIVTLLVLVAGLTPMPGDEWWQSALLLPHFEELAIWMQDLLPTDIADRIKL